MCWLYLLSVQKRSLGSVDSATLSPLEHLQKRGFMRTNQNSVAVLVGAALLGCIAPAVAQPPTAPPAQTAPAPRPTPPTRDPNTPGYVTAKELPDGAVPPADAYGNLGTIAQRII